MLRAGALYFAIVIAFFIAVVSASLIMLAAHYRNSYQKELRYQRLKDNLASGTTLALHNLKGSGIEKIDLYGQHTDSLCLKRGFWGVYELIEMSSFIDRDTLYSNFLLGKIPDSVTMYLSDEDRPLSLSGNTRITGDVQIPKSGLRQAYAEGKPYTGEKLVYQGCISDSQRKLPTLTEDLIANLKSKLEKANGTEEAMPRQMVVPFGSLEKHIYLGRTSNLENVTIKGKVILTSDSIITIAANANLTDVLVCAPIIKVADGFSGSCQLFARDSLVIGKGVQFNYPSALGILRTTDAVDQPLMSLGKGTHLSGILFSYEKERTERQTMVSLEEEVKIKGEVFCMGLLKVEKGVAVEGKVACNRFMMRTSQTLYENFLIDVSFNNKARSRYYLSSPLFGMNKENKVLKWLD